MNQPHSLQRKGCHQPRPHITASLLARICLLLLFASGCTDLEYSQKLTHIRTNCKGTEIVGVWVSKLKNGPYGLQTKFALLIRPDGSGIMRYARRESPVKWSYAGEGQWWGNCSFGGWVPHKMDIHYNGKELLLETQGMQIVFVKADDAAAVDEHLNTRR